MTLMGHDTSDSTKIYFVLIGYLIEYKKKLAKISAKCERKTKTKTDRYFKLTDIKDGCFKF